MSDKNNKDEGMWTDVSLQKLLHLKRYEIPDSTRMIRSRQNIMRKVREESLHKRSFGGFLEVNIPWFFAEPRYGIALLFIGVAALQLWGANSKRMGGE